MKRHAFILPPRTLVSSVFLCGAGIFCLLSPASAQQFSVDLGGGTSMTTRLIQMLALLTVLSVAPAIVLMVTSFTRMLVVFSFLRHAMGTQSTPPNMVLVSLAMFLTLFVMMPTLEQSYETGIHPLIEGQMDEFEAMENAAKPFHSFMIRHVRNQDLRLFLDLARVGEVATPEETPYRALIPAFMISELRRAFEIGFLIFLPFLIIDMVVASVLMSMGMMMLPPIMISMPFKIIFFVLIDGWHMIAGSLVQSFGA